jgi:hypothetical protein
MVAAEVIARFLIFLSERQKICVDKKAIWLKRKMKEYRMIVFLFLDLQAKSNQQPSYA